MTDRELGPQRRKTIEGRLLHCCCVCLKLEVWGRNWSTFCSVRELDDEVPIPKFCSSVCREEGGDRCINITDDMKRAAKDKEWRDPKPYYSPRTYLDALGDQQRQNSGERA